MRVKRSCRRWRYAASPFVWLIVGAIGIYAVGVVHAASWDPDRFAKEDIIRLRTICPSEGEYWFPVWLVVIDHHIFARLGSRAASRIECNTTPVLAVEVAGQKFDNIRAIQSPEMAHQVDAAMADKYWADIFIRWMAHPMTVRLDP